MVINLLDIHDIIMGEPNICGNARNMQRLLKESHDAQKIPLEMKLPLCLNFNPVGNAIRNALKHLAGKLLQIAEYIEFENYIDTVRVVFVNWRL